jgi:hypothetical protein
VNVIVDVHVSAPVIVDVHVSAPVIVQCTRSITTTSMITLTPTFPSTRQPST